MLTNLKEKQEKRKSHYCSFFFPLLFCRLMHGLVTHYLSWKCNYYIVQPTTNYNCRKRNYYFFWVHNKHSICRKVNMYIDKQIENIHSHIFKREKASVRASKVSLHYLDLRYRCRAARAHILAHLFYTFAKKSSTKQT